MAQLAPSKKIHKEYKNKTVHFFKSLPFFYKIIDRLPKPFAFVASQVASSLPWIDNRHFFLKSKM